MILKSDELDHPSNWPNGRYMGGYSLEGTYEDEYIGEHTATRDIGLASFPTLTKNSNNHNTNMTFDMELPLPNFNVYDGDLTIDGESDPGELVVNGTVQVGLQVRNEGEVPATDVLVEFYLDEQIIESQEIDLDGGEEDDIEFQWTPEEEHQGSDRVLTARVDPYDEIEEHDRENNEVSVTFDVLGRPDLRVEEISLEGDYTEGNNIMEGEDVLVSAIVANRGETGVEGVYSEVSIVSKDDNESESLGDELVSLSPEETREVGPFTWENPSTGNYSLKGVIDPDDEVDESDYRYNELERDASVLMAPDLTPEELTFSEDPVRIGNDVEITATITNQGEWTSEEMTVNFYVDDESEPFATRDRGGFSGGTSREVTVDWTAEMTVDEKEEMREITVSVEPDPNERDETNQELSKEITIERHRALVIEGVTTDPESEAIKGELVEVTASVKNVGDIGVDELEIVLRSEEDGEISRKNISEGLIVGESREINFIWDTSNVEPGYRNLIVEIPEDDVNEKGFTVSLPPRLDFVSTAWEVWSMEEEGWQELEDNESLQLEEKDDLRFNTTIENTGDALLSEGTVQITYPDGTWVNKTIEIGPGETVVVTDEWAAEIGENGGEMDITVRLKPSPNPDVEPYDSISQAVTIDPLDVRITDIVIPEDPAAGETYSFEGTLTRESDGMALRDTEVRVAIVSDGEELTSAFGTTDSEGRFLVTLQIPEGSGEYDVVFEPQTHNLQTVEESITVEEEVSGIFGIPWWLFIVIIAAAGGGVGSLFAYFKFFGPEEVVECGNCGASISADSTTCPNCGVEFDMDTVKCSECGEWIPATSDSCPECGAEFIKTGEEVEDYTDRMRKQYEKFVSQRKQRAESKLGRSLSKKEFLDWWRQQPSFVTFDQWLERKEKQRKEGGQECPNCGTLNSVDDAVCQKCGTSLVTFEEKETGRRSLRKQPGGESSETERSQGEAPRPPTEDELKAKDQGSSESTTRRSESKKDKRKRVKKKPKKRVKKKVVRDKEED
ncbi:MAG: CARDB domain-containing protein [Candidatus Aenigmatarchaeota archaeon]